MPLTRELAYNKFVSDNTNAKSVSENLHYVAQMLQLQLKHDKNQESYDAKVKEVIKKIESKTDDYARNSNFTLKLLISASHLPQTEELKSVLEPIFDNFNPDALDKGKLSGIIEHMNSVRMP